MSYQRRVLGSDGTRREAPGRRRLPRHRSAGDGGLISRGTRGVTGVGGGGTAGEKRGVRCGDRARSRRPVVECTQVEAETKARHVEPWEALCGSRDVHEPNEDTRRMLAESTAAVCFTTTWSAGRRPRGWQRADQPAVPEGAETAKGSGWPFAGDVASSSSTRVLKIPMGLVGGGSEGYLS